MPLLLLMRFELPAVTNGVHACSAGTGLGIARQLLDKVVAAVPGDSARHQVDTTASIVPCPPAEGEAWPV